MAGRSAKKQEPKRKEPQPQVTTPPIEWAVAALGAVLLAAALGYLAYFAVAYEEMPPQASVEAISVAPAGSGHLVRFRVTNRANGTAAQLQVKGELRKDGETVEEREATIDYLPPFSIREGGLFFLEDPGRYELVLSLGGYASP
jgi:uncharacterized protein (TIGR02588 family)